MPRKWLFLFKTIAVFFCLVILLNLSTSRAFATACPAEISDGLLDANLALAADTYDCSSVDLTINNGVTLTMQGNTTSNTGVVLQLSSLINNGIITAAGQGYIGGHAQSVPGEGPGGGYGGGFSQAGGGAGYGGYGGLYNTTYGLPYGDHDSPQQLGSGGGSGYCNPWGGNGGGAITLQVSGSLENNNTISANGNNGGGGCFGAGGGSGGSIYITTGDFSGTGNITANGGNAGGGSSGRGGGGRIAIFYSGNDTHSGSITATTGASGVIGENGTNILVDSTNNDLYLSATQTWNANPSMQGSVHNYTNIYIQNSMVLTLKAYNTTGSDGVGFVFNTTNFNLETGSQILSNATGYPGSTVQGTAGTGPGGGYSNPINGYPGGGGGHGAKGGGYSGSNGLAYDSLTNPTEIGSGGGAGYCGGAGGRGGGAIKITATGTVTLGGDMQVNGGAGGGACGTNGGGGSGGTINIQTVNLSGAGSLSANGGSATNYGAGGRIYVGFTGTSTYSGTTSATGSTPGTNLYHDITNDDLYLKTSQTWDANPTLEGSEHSYSSVTIQNSSTFTATPYSTTNFDGVGIVFNVTDFTLETGSSIYGTGLGYTGGGSQGVSGSGEGGGYSNPAAAHSGGGGGYGGAGGASYTGDTGGVSYGNQYAPAKLGSGGGGGYGASSGGKGGGAVSILGTGNVLLDGNITMNGTNATSASGQWGGGGSGGGIYVTAYDLSGGGTLAANGAGGGATQSGCGAGGRIALNYSNSYTFAGSTSVIKGTSCVNGSNGTFVSSGIPKPPSSLQQYLSDGTTSVSSGGTSQNSTMVFKVTMSAGNTNTLTPEVEVQEIGTSFTNSATDTGSPVAYSGSPVTGSVTVTGLSDLTNYHWQSRICDVNSYCTAWVSFGGSPYDFRVVLNQDPNAPTSLGPTSLVNGSYTGDATPSLSFTLADPDIADTVKYTILIDDTSNFSSPVVSYTSALGSQGSKSFTVGQAEGSGTYSVGMETQELSDGDYYWEVKAIDNSGAQSSYSVANSGSIAFKVSTDRPQGMEISSPDDNGYINSERPTFKWRGATTGVTSLSKYTLTVNNASGGPGEVSGDFVIDNIPTNRTTDYETDTYIARYENFGDSDESNDYITLQTKSSGSWSADYNDGKLREGKIDWTIKVTDSIGNSSQLSRYLYVDLNVSTLTDVKLDSTSINSLVTTTNTIPEIKGNILDSLSGGNSQEIQTENGPKIASGPKEIEIKIDKYKGSVLNSYLIYTMQAAIPTWVCDGTQIYSNTLQKCDKTYAFSYKPSSALGYGDYKVTITGKDNAGNSSSSTTFDLSIVKQLKNTNQNKSTPTPSGDTTSTPTPTPTTIAEPITQKDAAPGQLKKLVDNIVNVTTEVVNYVADVIDYGYNSLLDNFNKGGNLIADIIEWLDYSLVTFSEIVLDQEPTMITNVHIDWVSDTSAIVYWETNHLADSKVNFGETLDYGNQVQIDEKVYQHIVEISGLNPDTKYYYEVMSQNKNYVYDAHHEFFTLAQENTEEPSRVANNNREESHESRGLTPPEVPEILENTGEIASVATEVTAKSVATTAGVYVASAAILTSTTILQTLSPIYAATQRNTLMLLPDLVSGIGQWAFSSVSSYLPFIFGRLLKKRRKNKSVTFDSSAGSGLAGTYVLLYAADGTIKSDFTDKYGNFSIMPRPNRYKLRAEKVNYLYPSKNINKASSFLFEKVYKPGDEIVIEKEGQAVSNLAVPLDPEKQEKGVKLIFVKLKSMIHNFASDIKKPFLILGLIMSAIACYFSATLVNQIFLGVSVIMLIRIHGNKKALEFKKIG